LISKWKHPGGKLRELGSECLTDKEILAIIISTGIKGKPAEKIAEEILKKFNSLEGLANQPIEKLLEIKGLSDVKIIRIAAAYELVTQLIIINMKLIIKLQGENGGLLKLSNNIIY
jgi:DNA repair protein RadC